jgi:hypothetical protein
MARCKFDNHSDLASGVDADSMRVSSGITSVISNLATFSFDEFSLANLDPCDVSIQTVSNGWTLYVE